MKKLHCYYNSYDRRNQGTSFANDGENHTDALAFFLILFNTQSNNLIKAVLL